MQKNLAVVVGGSIAGLMAARTLARHFGRVIVLERDALHDESRPRKGVPQAHHVHILLTRGLDLVEEAFPGIVEEMQSDGVERVPWAEGIRWYQSGSWKTRQPCGIAFHPQTRVDLERRIRARLRQLAGVEIRAGANVQGYLWNADATAVTGVRIDTDGQVDDLAADLVVDASGRGSRTMSWIQAQGYPAPPVETTQIDLTYSSRLYQRTAAARDWQGLGCHPLPDLPRGGLILPLPDGRWLVTLFGYGDPPASDSPEDFLAFARGLPSTEVHDAIADATPLSDVVRFAIPQQRRVRFDRTARFPDHLLPIGDAVCSFDPVFGQGMTVAAQEAQALDRSLAAMSADAPARWLRDRHFRDCRRLIDVPWLITECEAQRFPRLAGRRSPAVRALQWYTAHVYALSAESPAAYRAFLEVMHLVSGPQVLARPAVLRGVLRRAWTGASASASAADRAKDPARPEPGAASGR